MRKSTKIWLAVAACLVLIGCMIFGVVMTVFNWDFMKLSTFKYETNDYKINEKYTNISLSTDTADVLFVPAQNAESSVVCFEQEKAKHSVFVKDGTLVIEIEDTRKWYEHIGISLKTPKITVCVPQGEYGKLSVKATTGDMEIPKDFKFESIDISKSTGNVKNFASASENIKIKTSTGKICVENVSSGALELSSSTGNITVSDVKCEGNVSIKVSTGKTALSDLECKSLETRGSTGSIDLNNVLASQKISVKRDTGNVRFDRSDAGEISVETDTGNVSGTLLSEKVFITKTDTGRVEVPKTTSGGKCEINTDTGNIKITIES